ncbi:trihelix transcription factor PTL [Trifolium repens]|nr:trihelix transcription factor PTL [Trifolium repens]
MPATAEDFFPGHRNLTALLTNTQQQNEQQQYEINQMMMLGRGAVLEDFNNITNTHHHHHVLPQQPPTTTTASASVSTPETTGCIGGDASTGRWPRQETLTLLEIRSRLDPKFKEANQKGPLWDEVSRIMSEEHGYQRSGKKCREKFENLYKYYKKTKEGKAGRHDGKHYRFFRQLEALYGENSNQTSLPETNFVNFNNFQNPSKNTNNQDNSLSLTNSTDFETSSSDDENDDHKGKKKSSRRRSWKVKIKEFIDSQMKKLVEKQEDCLSKLVKTLEEKENERVLREEEWRKQEVKRVEKEQKFWSKEREWIEARDAALMEALKNIGGREMKVEHESHHEHNKGINVINEGEIHQNNFENQNEDGSEILNSNVRGSDNYPRDSSKEGNKKRKENFYFNNNEQCSMYNQGSSYCDVNDQREEIVKLQRNDHGSSPSDSNVGNVANGDTCFPFLLNEGGNLWENFGLKINKSNQNH